MSFLSRRVFSASSVSAFTRFASPTATFLRPISTSRSLFADAANAAASSAGARESGTVKWFDASKGFGFITRDAAGTDLFVHFTAIKGQGYRTLDEGQKVDFSVGAGQKGPVALDVEVKPRE